MPFIAGILWGLIFAVLIAINVLLYIFTYPFIAAPVSAIIIMALIFIICNLKLKSAEFYLSFFHGGYRLGLKDFFSCSVNLNAIWSLIVVNIISFALSIMGIFLGGFVSAIYSIKDFAIADIPDTYGKEYVDLIPKITKPHIIDIAILKLSFFWWNLLIVLTLGLAAFYVIPYKKMTYAKMYKYLYEKYVEKD